MEPVGFFDPLNMVKEDDTCPKTPGFKSRSAWGGLEVSGV